jgi:hypothetical protein
MAWVARVFHQPVSEMCGWPLDELAGWADRARRASGVED